MIEKKLKELDGIVRSLSSVSQRPMRPQAGMRIARLIKVVLAERELLMQKLEELYRRHGAVEHADGLSMQNIADTDQAAFEVFDSELQELLDVPIDIDFGKYQISLADMGDDPLSPATLAQIEFLIADAVE